MHAEQRAQTRDLLKANGISRALFSHPDSVTWLTGFAPLLPTGQSAFSGGAPLVWYDNGHFTLIIQDAHAPYAAGFAADPDTTVVTCEGYSIDHPIRAVEAMSDALSALRFTSGAGRNGVVGVETDTLASPLLRAYEEAVIGSDEQRIDGWLKPLRMIKTNEEIAELRRAFQFTDVGNEAARAAAIPGAREIDVWAALTSAIQREAGCVMPIGNDCVVGYRQHNIGGLPRDHGLRPHDSLIVDLSVIHHGYWSDGCRTFYAGEPTADQIARHRFIENALDYAISLIRPGVRANAVDQQVRAFIERGGYPVYPHHTGHGIGVSGHEEPRLVPYNETVLEAGMVIMLEPGTYIPGDTGCRLEDALLITADGTEILTRSPRWTP